MNWNQGAEQFLSALSSDNPTPGGGAAAAMAGAMGCALALMAIGTTLKRKSTPQENKTVLLATQQKLFGFEAELKKLMQQDAQAYEAYMTARHLPADDTARSQAVQDALWFAATVPADIATVSLHVLQQTHAIEPKISPIILSDVYCANHLLQTAIKCSIENIRINMKEITDPAQLKKLQTLIHTFERGIQ